MPIYEFYCPDCETIFRYLSKTVDVSSRPGCPGCDNPRLSRRVSAVQVITRRRSGGAHADPGARRRIEGLIEDAADADLQSPGEMADVLCSIYGQAGVEPGEGMAEAIGRLDRGDDPEQVGRELGETIAVEACGATGNKAAGKPASPRAEVKVDPRLRRF